MEESKCVFTRSASFECRNNYFERLLHCMAKMARKLKRKTRNRGGSEAISLDGKRIYDKEIEWSAYGNGENLTTSLIIMFSNFRKY